LRAASVASLLSGGALGLVAIAGVPLMAGFPADARAVVILGSSAAAGLFFFNALGLWTSVVSPRKSNFRGVVGNELSFGATLGIGLGIAIALATAFVVEKSVPCALLLASWWGFTVVPVVCASLYLISFRLVSRAMTARRDLLTGVVSGEDRA
jgi:hypothetical protein